MKNEETAANRFRRFLAVSWTLVPPLLFSALVHATDPDVGGIGGLASVWTIVSIVVFAVPLGGLALLCLGFAVRWGRAAFLVTSVPSSIAVAVALVLLQSRQATLLEDVWTVLGGSLAVLAVFAIAALPAAFVGWPDWNAHSAT